MFCTNCGTKIEENAKFCTNCGSANFKEYIKPKPQKTNVSFSQMAIYVAVLVVAVIIWVISVRISSSQSLYNQGIDIIESMAEISRDIDYIMFFTSDPEIHKYALEIGSGNHSKAETVYSIRIPAEQYTKLISDNDLSDSSTTTQTKFRALLYGNISTCFAVTCDAIPLATANLCSMEEMFVDKNFSDDVVYLYTFQNAYPAVISFIKGNNGIINASGCFVPDATINSMSEREIEEYIEELTELVVEVDTITDHDRIIP